MGPAIGSQIENFEPPIFQILVPLLLCSEQIKPLLLPEDLKGIDFILSPRVS